MATTKTLTPTNQAITLAAFTEKPDNRTNVTNDDKLADAVNALNSKTTYYNSDFTDVHSNITLNASAIEVKNGIAVCSIAFKTTEQVSGYANLFKLPIRPFGERNFIAVTIDKVSIPCYVNSSGIVLNRANLPATNWIEANFSFMA